MVVSGSMTSSSTRASGDKDATGLEPFLNTICPYSWILAIAFGLNFLFAFFSLLSLAFLPSSAPSYPIALFTILLNGIVVVILAPMLYLCRRHNFY